MSHSWYGDVVDMTVLWDHRATLSFHIATGFYYAACRWEHGTTASSAGLLVNTANEFPALIPFIQVPVLTENMLSRAKRATSRSYIIKAYHLFQKTDPFEIFTEEINTQVFR